MADVLAESWRPGIDRAAQLINAALVLCADHELNVSAFTARCAASAGSTPYAVVNAGLAALQGPRHGGAVKRVEALFQECGRPEHAHRVLASRLKRGEAVPGFGHPLYPEGDPRGRMLVDLVSGVTPRNRAAKLGRAIVHEMEELTGEGPTIDLGLALLEDALELPDGAATAIFALGRTVGWIAHALEQYESRQLIRPRARYVGPPPVET